MWARGTLVVVVPFATGAVIAADSRSTIANLHFDNCTKIGTVPLRPDLAFAVTGHGEFVNSAGFPTIADAFQSAPRSMDIHRDVEACLSENPETTIEQLHALCLQRTETWVKKYTDTARSFLDGDLFNVVLVRTFLEATKVENFVIGIDAGGNALLRTNNVRIYFSDSEQGFSAFGETDYLQTVAFGGVGRTLFSAEVVSMIMEPRKVKEYRADTATRLARNIVDVTSQVAMIVPPPTGNGGPTHSIVLQASLPTS